MSLILFLVIAGLYLILTARMEPGKRKPLSLGRMRAPRVKAVERERVDPRRLHLAPGFGWSPAAHPNPHILVIGASGTGKTWTLRLLAAELRRLGFRCILFDFHGDLTVAEATSFRLSRESAFGANPLAVCCDREGGGPDLQRVEVIEYLRTAFRLGPLEVALLEDCLKAVYRQAGIREEEPGTWVNEMPHLGDLERELQARMAAAPKEGRLRRMKTKLSPLFDWRIFSKPDIPLRPSRFFLFGR